MFDFGRVSPFEEEWAKHQKSKRVYRGGVSPLRHLVQRDVNAKGFFLPYV